MSWAAATRRTHLLDPVADERASTRPDTISVMTRSSTFETQPLVVEKPATKAYTARPWNVIVWDDPINLMSYVVYVLQKLFGLSAEVAQTRMMEVHNEGRSIVATEERDRAEHHVGRLHVYGLQATLERVEDAG